MEVNGVEFQEEEVTYRTRPRAPERESFSTWLIRNRVAKSPIQANYLLLGIFILCVIVSIVAIFINSKKPVGPTPSDILRSSHMGPLH